MLSSGVTFSRPRRSIAGTTSVRLFVVLFISFAMVLSSSSLRAAANKVEEKGLAGIGTVSTAAALATDHAQSALAEAKASLATGEGPSARSSPVGEPSGPPKQLRQATTQPSCGVGGSNSSLCAIESRDWEISVATPFSSLTSNAHPLQLGKTLALTAVTATAEPYWSFQWFDLPIGCSTKNLSVLSCVPTVGGAYQVTSLASGPFSHYETGQVSLAILNGGNATTSGPAQTTPDLQVTLPGSSNPPPPGVWGEALAYDYWDGYVVLFGGNNGGTLSGDTWVWNDNGWGELWAASACASGQTSCKPCSQAPYGCPTARQVPSAATDPEDRGVLMFGGANCGRGCGGFGYFGDTWLFAGGTWMNLNPTNSPQSGWGAALAYYYPLSESILWGGETSVSGTGEYYEFVGGLNPTWNLMGPISPTQPLNYLWAPSMVWDGPDNYDFLFGGQAPGSGAAQGTAWSLIWSNSLNEWLWQQLCKVCGTAPTARYGESMQADGGDNIAVFGGTSGSNSYFNDQWSWQNGSWWPITAPQGPTDSLLNMPVASRALSGAATFNEYFGGSTATNILVIFGGQAPSSNGLAQGG
ncbi:MAG: hypothetical protein KGI89_16910, partial [Euryarchaeota archaeon]|nr:hypothetical protein [Euryarchaeota archaeon]